MLGAAAGGGFPQWNCFCQNCRLARKGAIPALTQSSIALKGRAGWVLVNASPDVTGQVRSLENGASEGQPRKSPLEHIFLTNADLDHILGLVHLREGRELNVSAPNGVWNSLIAGLRLPQVISSFLDLRHHPCAFEWKSMAGLEVMAVPLMDASAPPYSRQASGCHGVGYLFREREGAGIAGVFPDVAGIDERLRNALKMCDLVFFDGTFWDDEEMIREVGGTRTAGQMGHVPISGPGGSLPLLAGAGPAQCVYVHINNTNPILRPDSAERRQVEKAGLRIGADGMQFAL